MDIQNIEELTQRMNQAMERDLIDKTEKLEKLLSRSPDCPTLRKRERKNQEKLSMFYAGKKRRKGGRYA